MIYDPSCQSACSCLKLLRQNRFPGRQFKLLSGKYVSSIRMDMIVFSMQISISRAAVYILLACSLASFLLLSAQSEKNPAVLDRYDWPVYGGTPDNIHYSPLTQINRTNVNQLEVAWTFDTGERGGLQTSPIIVDGILYGITPTQ